MEFIIPLLFFLSHVVTFLLGYSFGARIWSFHHHER